MIRIVTGDTGEGKTKNLINMANANLTDTKGHIVYLDKDSSHIYALKHEIRYIDVSEFPIEGTQGFFGFMCGILSEDSDITEIYVDGLLKMAHIETPEQSDKLVGKLRAITDKFNVRLIFSINCGESNLPDFLQDYLNVV